VSSRSDADDAVIRAAKNGDADAWRSLYDDVGGRLVGWLRTQQTADAALDAEDIASEAWLTAARRIGEFNGSADDFAGWLFVIARNVMANTSRRSARRATDPTEIDPGHLVRQPAPHEKALIDAADWIKQMLSALPTREREVIAAIEIAGLDIASTSSLLNLTRTAVRSAHYRGLRRLAAEHNPDRPDPRSRPAEHPRRGRFVARLTAADE
jgi:RNA polymerase sigma-70 factor (ECF subfamily)